MDDEFPWRLILLSSFGFQSPDSVMQILHWEPVGQSVMFGCQLLAYRRKCDKTLPNSGSSSSGEYPGSRLPRSRRAGI